MMTRWLMMAVLMMAVGCSSEETDATGTAGTDQASVNMLGPETPAEPSPPQLEDGTDLSDWVPPQCDAGMMPVFGTSDCTSVGTPCPDGLWPDTLPEGHVTYLTPGGTGDGSSPVEASGNLKDALHDAPDGSTVLLSKGVFGIDSGSVSGVTLQGTCARDTVVSGTSDWGTIRATGGAMVRDLTVTGDGIGVFLGEGSTLEGVIIDGAHGFGLAADSVTDTVATQVVIKNTLPDSDGNDGQGIDVSKSGEFTLSHAFLDNNRIQGIRLRGLGSRAVISDTIIQNTQSTLDQLFGNALVVSAQSEVTMSRVLLDSNREFAMVAASSSISAQDIVIRDTLPREVDQHYGNALYLQDGGQITLTRALLDGNRESGIGVHGGSSLTAEDVTIKNTQSNLSGLINGHGIYAVNSTLSLARVKLDNNRKAGIYAKSTNINAEDIIIKNTLSDEVSSKFGYGLAVMDQSQLNLKRAHFDNNGFAGIFGRDEGTLMELQDIVVENTQSDLGTGEFGWGIGTYAVSSFNLNRAILRNNRQAGLVLTGGNASTSADILNLFVHGSQPQACTESGHDRPCDMFMADGLAILGAVNLTLAAFEASENARVGVYVWDSSGYPIDNTHSVAAGIPTIRSVGEGAVTGNDLGLNLWAPESTTQSWVTAFADVKCVDNTGASDGCYGSFQDFEGLPLPNVGWASYQLDFYFGTP